MEVSDPLADVGPPRYAVESDDEDEYHPLSLKTVSHRPPHVNVEFRSICEVPSKRPLVVVSGEAGTNWARVANLGEQRVGICVNNLPVGRLFLPSWTDAIIVVSESETCTQLPLFAMNTYATAVIERLEPTIVAILDSYPIQGFISPRVISQDIPTIRYLSIGDKPVSDPGLEPFTPPNLLQSTTACLLNGLFLRSIGVDPSRDSATVVLLPSQKAPAPPSTLRQAGATAMFHETLWDIKTLQKAHRWLFKTIGEEVGELCTGSGIRPDKRVPVNRQTLGEVGEGGMYI
ncbi:hypothetical protein PAXRUDRAFT_833399 [Paxillus rubicundulus Ve08.2h10]|uniref:Unplaced genomic scaffold scaffold_1144, whole genome shotgun sequence n=1 Tax=Paxillus rubicundulus Ve08.2h10 TaxID=930991 RepID=A0A0D0DH17_9AGAM|nr:hypothetical protein PAXRUDRAFT_833399 [Paxillus rubicundulus Ve08.2h10]